MLLILIEFQGLSLTESNPWWIGRGKPINPYLKGRIVELVRKGLKPKELILVPPHLAFEGERDNLEYTLYHNWMKLWLKWFFQACSDIRFPRKIKLVSRVMGNLPARFGEH